jgi:hypothetical protein
VNDLAQGEETGKGKYESADNDGRQLSFASAARKTHAQKRSRLRIETGRQTDSGGGYQEQHNDDRKVDPEFARSERLDKTENPVLQAAEKT